MATNAEPPKIPMKAADLLKRLVDDRALAFLETYLSTTTQTAPVRTDTSAQQMRSAEWQAENLPWGR